MIQRMNLKETARRYLGDTRLWRMLGSAKRRLEGSRPGHVLRKAVYRSLPRAVRVRMVQRPAFYGEDYFDREKDPTRESGYGAYYSDQQDFAEVARLAEELLAPTRVLDIGCARGYQVRAFLQRGIEAWGIDLSEHAVRTAPPELSGRLRVCDCRNADFPEGSFDLVTVLETLEHISPENIEEVVRGAARLTSRWLWATIPSTGPNDFGPDGIAGGKIKERFLPLYERGIVDFSPPRHLMLDEMGLPIHGHLIVASFDWWTSLFTRKGLARRGDLERVINQELGMAREGVWNCYILEKSPENPPSAEGILEAGWAVQGEGGRWLSEGVDLPAGRHLVELELSAAATGGKRRGIHRALMARAMAGEGDIVCGVLTLRRSDLKKSRGDGCLLHFPCSLPVAGTVRVEVIQEPGTTMLQQPVLRLTVAGWSRP